MAINDLFQALQMFQQGVQQAATTSAVNDANNMVQQINQAQMEEGKKRQALQQLGNELALRLVGTGANGTQIQAAFNAVNPQNFGSAEQLQLEGQLSGNQYYQQAAQNIIGGREQAEMRRLKASAGTQDWLAQREFERQKELVGLKAQAKKAGSNGAGGKALSSGDIDKIASLETSVIDAEEMLAQIQKDPNLSGIFAGRIPLRGALDPNFANYETQVQRFADAYRVLITGAAASDLELENLKKVTPQVTDTPMQVVQKLRVAIKKAQTRKNVLLKTAKAAGRDVSGFEGEQQAKTSVDTLKQDLINILSSSEE